MTENRKIRIGGASGYWGDSQQAPRQLVLNGDIDYLVFDYLAEITMSILARARQKDPNQGYVGDFITLVMKPLLGEIMARGIKVVANCGGVNVKACADALAQMAGEAGIKVKIGTVSGDDLMGQMDALRQAGTCEMFSGAQMPDSLISANAYLGAFPIAAALDAGADIVITGRCVDSAVTLGPLIHEFGWGEQDLDLLAAGTLAGHIIECGAQATGGNFTDWRDVVDGWGNMGYPIAECRADGTFIITKPENTGGLVSRLSVGEQMLYEIGDPQNYIMPDVVCDFAHATLGEIGANRVEVTGVRGSNPTDSFKVSATYHDGYRSTATMLITGFDAVAKGRHFAQALLKRTRGLFEERALGDYLDTAFHIIGSETLWGANAGNGGDNAREIVVQIEVRHLNPAALDLFSRESTGVALSMSTGLCGVGGAGRPRVTPVIAQFAFLIDKSTVSQRVMVDNVPVEFIPAKMQYSHLTDRPRQEDATWVGADDLVEVQLIEIAVARSGDKGNSANIGVIARSPEWVEPLRQALTAARVKAWFAHVFDGDGPEGEVTRFEVPGLGGFNFVLTNCLGGGGTSSLHLDKQAKTYGQQLLAMPVRVPRGIAERVH